MNSKIQHSRIKNRTINKTISLLTFSLFFAICSHFVSAQEQKTIFDQRVVELFGEKFVNVMSVLFGFNAEVAKLGDFIFFVLIVLILCLAFIDILQFFSPFSYRTNVVIGIALALFAGFSRIDYYLARFAFSLAAALGTLGVAIALIIAFAAFILLLIGNRAMRRWALRQRVISESLKKAETPAMAWRKLEAFEEAIR